MVVTAFNNGGHHRSGGGYGVRIKKEDRERYFQNDWKTVFVRIGNTGCTAEINIDKRSFWTKSCGELINKEIGKWLIMNKHALWEKRKPPKLNLLPIHEKHFELRKYSRN